MTVLAELLSDSGRAGRRLHFDTCHWSVVVSNGSNGNFGQHSIRRAERQLNGRKLTFLDAVFHRPRLVITPAKEVREPAFRSDGDFASIVESGATVSGKGLLGPGYIHHQRAAHDADEPFEVIASTGKLISVLIRSSVLVWKWVAPIASSRHRSAHGVQVSKNEGLGSGVQNHALVG